MERVEFRCTHTTVLPTSYPLLLVGAHTFEGHLADKMKGVFVFDFVFSQLS